MEQNDQLVLGLLQVSNGAPSTLRELFLHLYLRPPSLVRMQKRESLEPCMALYQEVIKARQALMELPLHDYLL